VLWRAAAGDRAQLDAFVAAAHEVGALALVEGVETPAHAALIRESGVDLAQGHLYGRPA